MYPNTTIIKNKRNKTDTSDKTDFKILLETTEIFHNDKMVTLSGKHHKY
jgi:hypothetical protein